MSKNTTRRSLTWAQRLKRVFDIDICRDCGGAVKVIAGIEDPVVILKILDQLKRKGETHEPFVLPESMVCSVPLMFHSLNPGCCHSQDTAGHRLA